jgi:hypothetical protein
LGDNQSKILLRTLFIGNIRNISKYGNDWEWVSFCLWNALERLWW